METLWERDLNVNDTDLNNDNGLNARRILSLADISDAGDVATLRANKLPGLRGAVDFALGKLVPLYGDRLGLLRTACGSSTAGPCAGVSRTSLLDADGERHVREAAHLRGWAPADQAMTESFAALWASRPNPPTGVYRLYHDSLQRFTIGGHDIDYLAKLVALAQAHHVKIALVVTPTHPVYYAVFDRGIADWEMIAAYWRTFAAQHGVALYDESHQPGYGTADFADPIHLYVPGAQKFSRWLATSIVAPMLA